MARVVVMAELRMETPMKAMAAMTRFSRMLARDVNCEGACACACVCVCVVCVRACVRACVVCAYMRVRACM